MTSIRAAVLRSAGEPAAVETLELADPRDGEVRVRIQASGVCHSDLHVGTAVLVGLTAFEARAAFGVYPLVDGSRRIIGSNYGFADPAIDFPGYAALHLAGRLPAERLIDRRIGLDDLEGAFDRLRAGVGLRQVVAFD